MSILDNMEVGTDVEENNDKIGSKFSTVETGLYMLELTQAYLHESKGEAAALVLEGKTADDTILRQTIYMTSGKAKGKKNYYIDKQGKKWNLPGYIMVENICLLTTGKKITDMVIEEKIVDIYDPAVGTQVPTKVDTFVELLGKNVLVGIHKQVESKNIMNPSTNKYVPTTETRTVNEFAKIFRAGDKMTVLEVKAKAPEAKVYLTWHDTYSGKTRNRIAKGTKVSPDAFANATAASATDLFA